ncbi:hypothetical protein HII17_13365 [Thalassotalea sp. M1531]|uniref:Uncharacterized protein n=1 Tax=Thalassotalea algicola TaxID=2716224 RepID=A0A7Y0LE68_9GAMM|nr:hypothetical protein [Thalassotalea algicola]NMP32549.1 hypothetical protein [Thalassotalea algicola]
MEVDYTKYSLSELRDCRENIDENAYPERVKIIEEQIAIRIKNGDIKISPKKMTKKESEAFQWAWGNLFLSLVFAFLAISGIVKGSIGNAAKMGNYNISEDPIGFWVVILILALLSGHRLYKSIKGFGGKGI